MRALKFKIQLMIAFFAAVDRWILIRFVFHQGSLLVIVIMIDGGENAIVKAAFEL